MISLPLVHITGRVVHTDQIGDDYAWASVECDLIWVLMRILDQKRRDTRSQP